jgi:hypothetical protein
MICTVAGQRDHCTTTPCRRVLSISERSESVNPAALMELETASMELHEIPIDSATHKVLRDSAC